MSRLIIDVSGEQHQHIKALAALQGKTIKNYVLEKLFPQDDGTDNAAWDELTQVLLSRIEDAENNPPAKKTFEQLTQDIIQSRK